MRSAPPSCTGPQPPAPSPQPPELVPVLVGTAGHVDHGKSAVVKLLTGCDTMRRPEERARGMTIDLGHAACALSGQRRVGIVDVPGHEDFIRNMVAGATAIDVVMLVVAADDGVMPQTHEHLRILSVLQPAAAIGVVNKIDLVDAERVAAVAADVRALLARAGFGAAPVVAVSCRSGEGFETLYTELDRLVTTAAAREPDARAFRMDVERAFAVRGHGTAAAGVPVSGRVAPGDPLELLPMGARTQVRGVQAFGRDAVGAVPGTCHALVLKELPPDDIARGTVLAEPGIYRAPGRLLVRLASVAETLALRHRQEVRLHAGTAAVVAACRLLDAESLPPGARGFALLTPREPIVCAAGDHLLLRTLNPAATVAGGTVLCTAPPARPVLDHLVAAETALAAGDRLTPELLLGEDPAPPRAEVERLTQLPRAAAGARVAASGLIDGGGRLIHPARVADLATTLTTALHAFHASHPLTAGMEPAQAAAALGLTSIAPLLAAFAAHGIASRHGRIALAGFRPPLPPRLLALRERVLDAVRAGGTAPPTRATLVQQLACPPADLEAVARLLAEERAVVAAGPHLLDVAVDARARAALADIAAREGRIAIAPFRAATGLSRNVAVALLESYDAAGLTRRVGDARVLRQREEVSA